MFTLIILDPFSVTILSSFFEFTFEFAALASGHNALQIFECTIAHTAGKMPIPARLRIVDLNFIGL